MPALICHTPPLSLPSSHPGPPEPLAPPGPLRMLAPQPGFLSSGSARGRLLHISAGLSPPRGGPLRPCVSRSLPGPAGTLRPITLLRRVHTQLPGIAFPPCTGLAVGCFSRFLRAKGELREGRHLARLIRCSIATEISAWEWSCSENECFRGRTNE